MSAALCRIYPHLADIANKAISNAGLPAGRQQAVWWDGRRWQVGPCNGSKFVMRPADSRLAGVYTAQASAIDIVQDMLLAVGEVEVVK